jgi:hypothetical protein|tara:strand:- start:748 stop:852 length:105 start_codon:yes stop_codon:yes gene_type:complete
MFTLSYRVVKKVAKFVVAGAVFTGKAGAAPRVCV